MHKGEVQLPAIYFLYDLSPIMVNVRDAGDGLAHLLVRICAVVGGVFAITGKVFAQSQQTQLLAVDYSDKAYTSHQQGKCAFSRNACRSNLF